ncbi:hypothetical protein [Rhodococcus opacus]|uniref:Terminase n=1 Tax=Rhodococcus opacus (strain B4) TaxID=632772 RepID=C1B9C6_RHOOB|nr:hypothetical protein [Rhodococcus opacus]BAH52279.1 hypothetical protein ROP_40320 [Rhodococcus opacus B4]
MTDLSPKLLEPAGLLARGKAMWQALTDTYELDAATAVLAAEACRIADRLERMNGILRGRSKEWITFEAKEDGSGIDVIVDNALSEARQQQLALNQILKTLGVGKLDTPRQQKGGGLINELAERAAAREAAARLAETAT